MKKNKRITEADDKINLCGDSFSFYNVSKIILQIQKNKKRGKWSRICHLILKLL